MLVNVASHQEFTSSSLAQHSNKFQKNVFSSVCLRNLAERQTEIIPLVTWKIYLCIFMMSLLSRLQKNCFLQSDKAMWRRLLKTKEHFFFNSQNIVILFMFQIVLSVKAGITRFIIVFYTTTLRLTSVVIARNVDSEWQNN